MLPGRGHRGRSPLGEGTLEELLWASLEAAPLAGQFPDAAELALAGGEVESPHVVGTVRVLAWAGSL